MIRNLDLRNLARSVVSMEAKTDCRPAPPFVDPRQLPMRYERAPVLERVRDARAALLEAPQYTKEHAHDGPCDGAVAIGRPLGRHVYETQDSHCRDAGCTINGCVCSCLPCRAAPVRAPTSVDLAESHQAWLMVRRAIEHAATSDRIAELTLRAERASVIHLCRACTHRDTMPQQHRATVGKRPALRSILGELAPMGSKLFARAVRAFDAYLAAAEK
jgi:hypothetical protein